jgi:hypothetical protein
MAQELARLCARNRSVLAVLEIERMEGVLGRLFSINVKSLKGDEEE